MSPERWQQVEKLYAECQHHDPDTRAAFLKDTCSQDTELRREVESLLAEADRCSGFLRSDVFESALRSILEPGGPTAQQAVPANRRPAFFWFAIAAGIAMLAFYACAGWIFFRNIGGKDIGWEYRYSRGDWIVTKAYADGPAAGTLEPGDQVLAINEDRRAARTGPEAFRHFLPPGSEYSVRVLRGGHERFYKLHVVPWQDSGHFARSLSYILLSIVTFAAGLALGLLKPGDRTAQLGCLAAFLAAIRCEATPLSLSVGTAPDLSYILNQLASFSFPGVLAVGYHFFRRFSSVSAREPVWRALFYLLYGVTAGVLISQLTFFAASLRGQEALVALAWRHFWLVVGNTIFLQTSWSAILVVALAAICAVSIWGYRRSTDLSQRRRVRWFAFGCAFALTPMLILNLIAALLIATDHSNLMEDATWWNLRWAADLFQFALPASLAFAVLKHGLLDIRVVVRRGFRYLLAARMLQALLLLPALALLVPIIRNPNRTLAELFFQSSLGINLVLLALTALSLWYRRQLRTWLDRRFFREAYRQEEVLQRLMSSVKDLDSMEDVSRLVCKELDSALHPAWLYLCQWRGESRKVAVVRAAERGPQEATAEIPASIVRLLQSCNTPQECAIPRGQAAFASADSEKLLIVPVGANTRAARGALLLGEKRSEEPYTDTDRRLLEGVADSIAVVFENLWLKKRVDEGLRERREVLGRLDREAIGLLQECPECGLCFDSLEEKCPADGSTLILSLPVERTIEERYRLDRRIGKGGMGVVFEATDLNLGRQVAVKVMLGNLFGDQTAVRRFVREARVLAQLSHPNIVAIHDFGRIGGAGAYIVMERLTGASWRSELQRRGTIPLPLAAVWFDQLLNGLHAAHRAGVVHRDLKPENVIITAGPLKILDFGVAKARLLQSQDATSVTETGVILGTLSYMSPEQLRGDPAGEASDIFAFGLMAVEAITGRLPPRGALDGSIVFSALEEQLRNNPARRILARCLANEVKERCSIAEIREELAGALDVLKRSTSSSP